MSRPERATSNTEPGEEPDPRGNARRGFGNLTPNPVYADAVKRAWAPVLRHPTNSEVTR